MRVGIFDHFGWAIAVTATAGGDVVDRRRIELVEPGLTRAPVHYDAAAVDDSALAALDATVRGIESIPLRRWPADVPADLATIRRAPYESRADVVMYRQELARV